MKSLAVILIVAAAVVLISMQTATVDGDNPDRLPVVNCATHDFHWRGINPVNTEQCVHNWCRSCLADVCVTDKSH